MGINKQNMVGYIIDWEDGSLSEEDTIELFQYIYDNNLQMSLQGMYGRFLHSLIEAGLINTT